MSAPVDFALEYASRGWVVMPLRRGDNRPHGMLGNGWSFDWVGSTDPRIVQAWWTDRPWYRWWEGVNYRGDRTTPVLAGWEDGDSLANIGIVCGARSRLLVIDVDRKGPVDGWESLTGWESGRRLLTAHQTRWSRTPSGGGHAWFTLPSGRDVRRKAPWLPSVDACGSGGFVAAPPSCRSVTIPDPRPFGGSDTTVVLREYEWVNETSELAEAPEYLITDIETRHASRAGVVGSSGSGDGALLTTEEFLEGGFGICSGSRNKDCYRLAWRLWNSGLEEREVIAICLHVMDRTSQHPHPFTWGECYRTILSAERAWRNTREAERRGALDILKAWTGE